MSMANMLHSSAIFMTDTPNQIKVSAITQFVHTTYRLICLPRTKSLGTHSAEVGTQ